MATENTGVTRQNATCQVTKCTRSARIEFFDNLYNRWAAVCDVHLPLFQRIAHDSEQMYSTAPHGRRLPQITIAAQRFRCICCGCLLQQCVHDGCSSCGGKDGLHYT